MNENLNLVEILKNVPTGTKLYSPLIGECKFDKIDNNVPYCIKVLTVINENHTVIESFDSNGKRSSDYKGGECLLFPSRENRDWSTFYVEPEVKKWEDIKYIKGYYIDDFSDIQNIEKLEQIIPAHKNLVTSEKICKSMLAMAQISQLMPYYGGEVTDEEWKNKCCKYVMYHGKKNKILLSETTEYYEFLAFHTSKQRDSFLENNRQLVKDYLMIE